MAAPNVLPARGVYRALFKSASGNAVVIAITSRGERSGEVEVKGRMTEDSARRVLLKHLSHVDPVTPTKPRLRLHR